MWEYAENPLQERKSKRRKLSRKRNARENPFEFHWKNGRMHWKSYIWDRLNDAYDGKQQIYITIYTHEWMGHEFATDFTSKQLL